ncbi:histidinol-phosphatase [bacterium]|jgi:histidinol-phosphatase|nr:histidinol-phosphatase [bacterium]
MKWIPFLQAIVAESDKMAMTYYTKAKLKVEHKDDMSPVSEGDLAIENHIRKLVAETHPELSIIGEEYGETQTDSDVKLIIDPIDGTKNFIKGIPFFATLLAIEEKGEVVAGFVSAPANNDHWWAEKGCGAFYNGDPIQVSTESQLDKSQAFHGSLWGSEATDNPEPLLSLLSETWRQRGFGDYYPAMMVAMGKGEFAVDFKLKPWDMAPIKIIIEEAGGQFSDTSGQDSIYSGNFIASNGKLHETVVDRIRGLK